MKGMLYVLYVSIALAASLLAIGVIVFRSWTGKNGKEGAEKFRIKDTLLLRMIHLSWILWFLTFAFTVIISPYMFLYYYIPYVIILLSVISAITVCLLGYKLGKYFMAEIYQKYELWLLWCHYFFWILFAMTLALDIASVATESVGMFNQYQVYTGSVTIFLITTMLLTLPLIFRRKGNTEDKNV